ncbi:hypothetical protein F0U62_27640 [Cystobacter fuscus]|nr:hypothetical protein F0U62_27640 [Cystobacter fuscus]
MSAHAGRRAPAALGSFAPRPWLPPGSNLGAEPRACQGPPRACPLPRPWQYCGGCKYAEACRGGCTQMAHVIFNRNGNNPCSRAQQQVCRDRESLMGAVVRGDRPRRAASGGRW